MASDTDRDALALFPSLAALPADATVKELRAAGIRDMVAAGMPLRRIANVLNCSVSQVREDLALPRRPPARRPADGN